MQMWSLIKIKKNKNLKLKTEACRNDRTRQKKTLSRSITDMDVLMMRRRSPYGIFLRMIHHLQWMSRHQKRGDLRVDLQRRTAEGFSTEEKLFPDPTPIMASIIQWNCRGLNVNFIEITLLVQALLPVGFCL